MTPSVPIETALCSQLREQEIIITRGHQALLAAAEALRRIHDEHLFLAVAGNWREYVQHHAPVGVRQVYRWLGVARILASLPADLRAHPSLPDSERAYRQLAEIPTVEERAAVLRSAIDAAADCRTGVGSQHILAAQRRLAEAASPADPSVKPMAESPAPVISDGGNADAAEPQQRRLSPTAAQRMLHDHIHRLRDIQRAIANFPRLRREAQDLERVIIQLQRLEAGAPWTTQHTTP